MLKLKRTKHSSQQEARSNLRRFPRKEGRNGAEAESKTSQKKISSAISRRRREA